MINVLLRYSLNFYEKKGKRFLDSKYCIESSSMKFKIAIFEN